MTQEPPRGERTEAPEPSAGPVTDPLTDPETRRREAGVSDGLPFGRPGSPLSQAHPFMLGFVGALGVITAWQLFEAFINARQVLVLILVSMFLAVGLNPAVERLTRLGLSRGPAVTVVFLCVILGFVGFGAALVPPITEQVTGFIDDLPGYVQELQNNQRIADFDRRYQLLQRAEDTISKPDFQQDLAQGALGLGKVAITGIFSTLTILILTLYFLSSLPQIKSYFYRLAPRTRRARVMLLGDEILNRIGGYVGGQLTISIIAGASTYIFLLIVGLPYALALSLIVAATALIPLIGATLGAIVVTIVGFLTGIPEGIACVIFFVVYQQTENYLVAPRVMKRSVDVAPMVTVVAALIGGTLLGVVGALLAIPTAAAIALIVREVIMPRQEAQ